MTPIYTSDELMPTEKDVEKIISAKLSFEAAQVRPDRDAWNKKNFTMTPWGIGYTCSKSKYNKSVAVAQSNGWAEPRRKANDALKYLIIAIAIDWQDLIDQLKKTVSIWGYTSKDLQQIATNVWRHGNNADKIAKMIEQAQTSGKIKLTEAIEKHDTLNNKLFTKDEQLKAQVRNKMLEIVDTFLADLDEQEIKIKVDDILLIGSNASYNYTKNSDIDLHILANTKATKYSADVADALYSAYRSLFNKSLDIKLFDIPLELFVETEASTRVSNGIYSVKKDKWIKRPENAEIPDYDKQKLAALVDEWETTCKKLISDIEADKLDDEKQVIKLLEDIYEKLRKKGISKGEYSEENLAFKELRNKGYLDKLKEFRNELTSKRLSLDERLTRRKQADIYNKLTEAAGCNPIIQDNGMFFIYNLKPADLEKALRSIKALPFVLEASTKENGKYDFSEMATTKLPTRYYDIRGTLSQY